MYLTENVFSPLIPDDIEHNEDVRPRLLQPDEDRSQICFRAGQSYRSAVLVASTPFVAGPKHEQSLVMKADVAFRATSRRRL